MRIQHNITAMNAYRNYSNNTSALAKNLEKLSSGYKINRAGDDAAGLAISEKMRAQISGLEQAQANAKSGISLVQTAEGALTEVHDMLNRMVTLAEQSANGTYDNDVDRVQLQKEVDQLRTEINRIADSSNFNGIKLLDGSLALSDATEATTTMNVTSGMDRILSTVMSDGELAAEVAGEKTILDSFNGSAAKGSFTVDLTKISFSNPANVVAASATMGTLNISIGDFSIDITLSHGSTASSTSIKASITFMQGAGEKATSVTATASATAASLMEAIASKIAAAITSAASKSATLNNVQWSVSNASGVLTFAQVATATSWEEAQTNFDVQVTWSGNSDSGTTSLLTNDVVDSSSTSGASFIIKNSLNDGTVTGTAAVPDIANNLANTVFSITADDIKDGTQIVIGTKTYVLAVGADSKWTASAVTALGSSAYRVDLTSMDADNVDLNRALQAICKKANGTAYLNIVNTAGTLARVGFALGVSDGSNGVPAGITLVRNGELNKNSPLFDTLEKLAANFKVGVLETTEAKGAGKGLTLQIGDTADEFNQLSVSISDCHADAMGIGDIDISTQEGASKAVDLIKDAINYVSDVRGTLGATQNRLDHTINNLSVMQENIQDAESTIRDVDVAEEMMEYTKNSILVQSAQAMLAQANQLPQGVLQLLQ